MSISLAAQIVQTLTVGGAVTETVDAAAVTSFRVDYLANQIRWEVASGQVAGDNLSPGPHGQRVSITVDLATGNWRASSGQSGTFPANTLAAMEATFNAIRNTLESYVIAGGIVPGTAVPWQ